MDNLTTPPRPVNGAMILVFGTLGVVGIPIFGPAAWIMGSRALKVIDSGQGDPAQRSIVATGRICGMVGTVVGVLLIYFVLAVLPRIWSNAELRIVPNLGNGIAVPVSDPNLKTIMSSRDPLGIAIMERNAAAVNTILDQDATLVNRKGVNGETPLFDAAFVGDKDVVAAIIAHGADVNAKNDFGDTPLDKATMFKHDDVIALLKSHGAMPGTGSSPMSIRHNVSGSSAP